MVHKIRTMLQRSLLLFLLFGWGILSAQQPITVDILSYNIRYNTPDDGVHRWDNRKPKLESLLPIMQPDVIGFQEALFLQVRDLQEMLPGYEYVGVGRKDGGVNGEMVPIFYKADRFHVLYQGTFWLSDQPDEPGSVGWDAALPRIATWVVLEDKKNDKELLVVNTHFDHAGAQSRTQSAQLLLAKIPELAQGRPYVVLGDFNAQPEEEPVQQLLAKWLDARAEAPTVMGPEATFTGFTSPEPKKRIDYIFISPLLTVNHFSTISTNMPGSFFSDHLPIKAQVVLP